MSHNRGCLARIGNLVAAVLTLYAVLMLLSLAISLVLPESIELVGVIKGINGIALLFILIALPLALLLRRWRVSLLLLPVAAAFVVIYGGYFVPRSIADIREETFTVLTFNLKAPQAGEVAELIDVIRVVDADFVALQELSPAAANEIEQELRASYAYMALHPQADDTAGQGLLSRFEITSSEFFDTGESDDSLGHLRAELLIDGSAVAVYSVHPPPPFAFSFGLAPNQHGHEVDGLLEVADQETIPVLMVGDFNMSDQFEDYGQVAARYTDAYRAVGEVGFGFTYPAGGAMPVPPVLRLDYVFYDANFTGEIARVWLATGSSDHHPVWARLTLRPQ